MSITLVLQQILRRPAFISLVKLDFNFKFLLNTSAFVYLDDFEKTWVARGSQAIGNSANLSPGTIRGRSRTITVKHYYIWVKNIITFSWRNNYVSFLHETALILQLKILFFFKKGMYVYKSKWQNVAVVLGHNIPFQLD